MALGARRTRVDVLSKVPLMAALDHRYALSPDGKHPLFDGLNREQRRKLDSETKYLASEYLRVLKQIMNSGAGFPVDKFLHELCVEYTHRFGSSGIYTQPLSFNYFDTFCEILLHKNSVAPYAKPAVEIDHLFTLLDFIEYVTSEQSQGFSLDKLKELPADRALHFTAGGQINDFTFLTPAGREFVISGFSMIRRGNYVSWYIVGGEQFSDVDWQTMVSNSEELDLGQVPPWKQLFINEAAENAGNRRGPPVLLEGTKSAQRTVIVGEIDIVSQKHLGRCSMSEWANVFDLVCDDPQIFDHLPNSIEKNLRVARFQEKIRNTEVMWLLSEAFLQLPAYFAFKVQIVKPTLVSAGVKVMNPNKKGGQGIGANFKTVSTLNIVSDNTIPVRSYTPQHYQAETDGYWRRLAPATVGVGIYGEIVKGRTWIVKKNARPIALDTPPTIYVKSTIAAAKIAVEQYSIANAASENSGPSTKKSQNVLYVLRCATMHEEVYKVGWTSDTAENRAKQISSATGVPNAFIVVNQWQHPAPEALEKNVHALLDGFRVVDNREFFKVSIATIRQIIEGEIERTRQKLNETVV
jgi:T5orf172 domain